jgi:hypothetical protein
MAAETIATSAVRQYFATYSKLEALESAVNDLFLCLGRKSSAESRRMHVSVLMDLDVELLIEGFTEAFLTTKDWLTPGAVREMCLGGSRGDVEATAADEAWGFVVEYLRNHGVDGRVKRGALVASEYTGNPVFLDDKPAPDIPVDIYAALTAVGGTIPAGLQRINLAKSDELPWLKKEFAAAFSRATRTV